MLAFYSIILRIIIQYNTIYIIISYTDRKRSVENNTVLKKTSHTLAGFVCKEIINKNIFNYIYKKNILLIFKRSKNVFNIF